MIGFLVCLAAIVPQTEAVHDHVATIELNHYYDFNASHVFDQIIYRDSDGAIIAWNLVKSASHKPIGRRLTFYDGHTLRDIRCNRVYESWTQVDPELEERSDLPPEQRRGLGRRVKDFYKEP